ncbi:hypothetical protein TNCV_3136111 [Trichonephila clavipes]|nr:hypothetical protein TNCV_3136111 [Trichonephila clavipes]
MKCMHLGEQTEDMPTQRDKPSNIGEKTEDTSELNETSPQILVCEDNNRWAVCLWHSACSLLKCSRYRANR